MSETIYSKTPNFPKWIKDHWEAEKAWKEDPSWRVEAAQAEDTSNGYEQVRRILLKKAKDMYGEDR